MVPLRKKLSKIFLNRDSESPTDKTKPMSPSPPEPDLPSLSNKKSTSSSPTKSSRRSPSKAYRQASAPISSLFDTLSDGFKWSASLLHNDRREPAILRPTQEDAKSPSQQRSRSARWSATWSKSLNRSKSGERYRRATSSEVDERSIQSDSFMDDDSSVPLPTSAMAPALQVDIPDSVLRDLTASNHPKSPRESSTIQPEGLTTWPGPIHVTFDEASLKQTSRSLLRRRSSCDDPFLQSEPFTRLGTFFRQVGSALEVRHPCGRAVYWCQCCKSPFKYSETAQKHTTNCTFQDQSRAKIAIGEESRAHMFRHPYEAAVDPFQDRCMCYKGTIGRPNAAISQSFTDFPVKMQGNAQMTGQAHSTSSEGDVRMRDDRWTLPSYQQSCQEASSLRKLSAEVMADPWVEHQDGIQQSHASGGPVGEARLEVDNGHKVERTSSTAKSTSSWGNSPTLSEGVSSSTVLSTAPTVGSRSSWESARAERNKKYLALPSYDDDTQSESGYESSLQLQRCSPENDLKAQKGGFLRSSSPHTGLKCAVQAIDRASGFELDPDLCSAEGPVGRRPHSVLDAIERRSGLDPYSGSTSHDLIKNPNYESTVMVQPSRPIMPVPSSDDPYEAALLAAGLSHHRRSTQGSPQSESTIESLELSADDTLAPNSLSHRFASSSGPSSEFSSCSSGFSVGRHASSNLARQHSDKANTESTSMARLSSPSPYLAYESQRLRSYPSDDLLKREGTELSDSDSGRTLGSAIVASDPLHLDIVERQTKELFENMYSTASYNDEGSDDVRHLDFHQAESLGVESELDLSYGASSSSLKASESPVNPRTRPFRDITNYTTDVTSKPLASKPTRSASLIPTIKVGFTRNLATSDEPACRRLFSNIDDNATKDQAPYRMTEGNNNKQQDNTRRSSDEALTDSPSSVYSRSVD